MGYLERRRIRCFARPSAAIVDSQSVKVSDMGGETGYDSNKKIKGRKRHILVDTLGNLLDVVVSAANMTDLEGLKILLTKVERQIALRLLKIWADQSDQGDLEIYLHEQWGIALEIVSAQQGQTGFVVQPRRWLVERTFAWLGKYRRLSKDYERHSLLSPAKISSISLPFVPCSSALIINFQTGSNKVFPTNAI